jgi:RNA polymerase sigma-70 factor (ECF subfamily)
MDATGAQFPLTRWSLVAAAGGGDPQARRQALEEICRQYWLPLYAFARRKGSAPSDAEDATQSFLAVFLNGDGFAGADRTQGSLRTYLLTRFQTFLINSWRRENSQKRGGQVLHLALDFHEAEERCASEWQHSASPDAAFEKQWVSALLEAVMRRVQENYQSTGRSRHFDVLRPFLNFDETGTDYAGAAEELGLSAPAVRQAVHRLRERFSRELRSWIAETLADPSEEAIDEELAALRTVLAG